MEEIWKDIKGYEGLYQVSNLGRVKSSNYGRMGYEKILKPNINRKGYHLIGLHLKGKVSCAKIHRLVAIAFIPNPNNYPQVNHIDGNPGNNSITNLEWCDNRYNTNHAYKIGLHIPTGKHRKVYCKELDRKFKSMREAAKYFECDPTTIKRCCDGIMKQLHKKYTFEYIS